MCFEMVWFALRKSSIPSARAQSFTEEGKQTLAKLRQQLGK